MYVHRVCVGVYVKGGVDTGRCVSRALQEFY